MARSARRGNPLASQRNRSQAHGIKGSQSEVFEKREREASPRADEQEMDAERTVRRYLRGLERNLIRAKARTHLRSAVSTDLPDLPKSANG
jgi:hypothetical protein